MFKVEKIKGIKGIASFHNESLKIGHANCDCAMLRCNSKVQIHFLYVFAILILKQRASRCMYRSRVKGNIATLKNEHYASRGKFLIILISRWLVRGGF